MARKDTVWGARHFLEEQEIKRIVEEYKKMWDIEITKLEASAILAQRSKNAYWTAKTAKDFIGKMRGL